MKYHFKIEGMTCGSCSARVQSGLDALSHVDLANVNLALKT
jgi:copper chaperone CopZ